MTIQSIPSKIIRPFLPEYVTFCEHPSGMKVELIDAMGSDLDIVNAARVSYGKQSQYEDWHWNPELKIYTPEPYMGHTHTFTSMPVIYKLAPADLGVLGYMMREHHGSPFEMVVLKFRVKAPIKVIWEWVRHRISSFNIKSTRYVEWDKDFYVPEAAEWRRQVGRPGRYTTETITDGSQYHISVEYERAMESAFNYYGILVGMGLHKEVAANVLPMGAMTEMIWCVNARSLMNFLALRTDSHALQEIQICANMVEELSREVIPVTLDLWTEYGKRAP